MVYVQGSGSAKFTSCILSGNKANRGGVVYVGGHNIASVTFISCTLSDNIAVSSSDLRSLLFLFFLLSLLYGLVLSKNNKLNFYQNFSLTICFCLL